MTTAGLWLTVVVSGLYHGLNPAMGWPLAVSAALMGRGRRSLFAALAPLALGHFLAMAGILLPFALLTALVQWQRQIRIGAALVVTILCVAACADSAAICSQAGGEYANGACTLSDSSQLAVRHWCETHGGVYLAGPNTCGYGSGGP